MFSYAAMPRWLTAIVARLALCALLLLGWSAQAYAGFCFSNPSFPVLAITADERTPLAVAPSEMPRQRFDRCSFRPLVCSEKQGDGTFTTYNFEV
jgi:hypothetical protein